MIEPRSSASASELGGQAPLLQVKDLKMHFAVRGGVFRRRVGTVHAVDGVTFSLNHGETLGLVGESGCGKSTLGRTVIRLNEPTAGSIVFGGTELAHLSGRQLRPLRTQIQMIFQDPFSSLNPRNTVGAILEGPLALHGLAESVAQRKKKVLELLDKVGLPEDAYNKFPHEFSGGQRQRIGVARAISLSPSLVICDEAVSALDVSVQSQVLNLLLELQRDMNLSYLFISHDLAVVRHMSDRVAVMYLGRIVELTDADSIYERAAHPYTQALLSAIPEPTPETREKVRQTLHGDVPSPISPPSGCHFHTRCPWATDRCRKESPVLRQYDQNEREHQVACHFPNASAKGG